MISSLENHPALLRVSKISCDRHKNIYIYVIWKDGETIESIFRINIEEEWSEILSELYIYIIIIPKIFSIREKIEIDKIEKTF